MDKVRIKHLLHHLANDLLTYEEKKELETFLAGEENRQLFMEVADEIVHEGSESHLFDDRLLPILARTLAIDRITPFVDGNGDKVVNINRHSAGLLKSKWLKYAAAVMLLSGACTWLYVNSKKLPPALPVVQSITTDVPPASGKAVLTLSDGSNIVLDNATNGQLANQDGVRIIKKADGELEYSQLSVNDQPELMTAVPINTMSTPRGGQYQLTLPDKTKVWLNAGSSITYPTLFTGSRRNVSVTGEVYFEVMKNAKMPFHVRINEKTAVEVLGTHFNINAYADEPGVRTTLLEGKVKISFESQTAILKPGEQAQSSNHGLDIIRDVNLQEAVAWKDGYFSFHQSDLAQVMREISRWYDVDVEYRREIPKRRFGGEISRNSTLSEVLKILQESKVNCIINNKKIIVLP
jgi:transmembrane sensor